MYCIAAYLFCYEKSKTHETCVRLQCDSNHNVRIGKNECITISPINIDEPSIATTQHRGTYSIELISASNLFSLSRLVQCVEDVDTLARDTRYYVCMYGLLA